MKRSISQQNPLFFGPLCFQFFFIVSIFFFSFSLYVIILYSVLLLAGQDCHLGFFNLSKTLCCVFLVIYLSSTIFVFKLSQTGFLSMWFAFLFGCIWVHLCVRMLAKQTI